MTRNPAIAFGLSACAAAMKAKAGRLCLRDQLDLARRALEFHDIDPAMRAEVLEFLDACNADPVSAGVRLHAQVVGLAEVMAPSVGAEQRRHDWQTRKDCGI